ncbi:MAG: SDR family oxidoreductase [Gammaproteobacteria bacterium]|nr:SDR family oxidoreductase [Gammaproteobacteria bacterium]
MNSGRTLVITGASGGIGKAITTRALQGGWTVIGMGRDFSKSGHSSDRFSSITMDLSSIDELPETLKKLHHRHPEVDGLVLNAGYGHFGSLEEFSPTQVRNLIDLNLTSQILLAREFLPAFKARKTGDLVFMGSEAALSGGRKGAVYSATKFALRGLAQSLREECAGSGVRVGIVNPGMVRTGFFDHLGFQPGDTPDAHLEPEDVAEAVWLMLNARPGAAIDEINLSPQKKVIQFRK